jgi:hypothetical protein
MENIESAYPKLQYKIDDSFDFVRLDDFDIAELSILVNKFTDEWNIDSARQNSGLAQSETNVFWVIDLASPLFNPPFSVHTVSENHKANDLILPILKIMEQKINGLVARAMLARLPAKSTVHSHKDSGRLFEISRRFHIPITTNNKCSVVVAGREVFMNAGECWEISNLRTHSAKNDGDTDRVHLIFDVIPEYLIP